MAITQKIFLLTIIITLFVVCFTFAARGETTRTEIMPGFPIKKDMEIQPTIPKQNFSCNDYLQQIKTDLDAANSQPDGGLMWSNDLLSLALASRFSTNIDYYINTCMPQKYLSLEVCDALVKNTLKNLTSSEKKSAEEITLTVDAFLARSNVHAYKHMCRQKFTAEEASCKMFLEKSKTYVQHANTLPRGKRLIILYSTRSYAYKYIYDTFCSK